VEGDHEMEFGVEAIDPNGHPLTYGWFVNGEHMHLFVDSSFTHTFIRDGDYTVTVIVSDRLYLGTDTLDWEFEVYGSDVPEDASELPMKFRLDASYPNPFNETTRFMVDIDVQGEVSIKVNDLFGRKISQIWQGYLNPGRHSFTINSAKLPAGTYFLSADKDGVVMRRRLILLK